MIELIPGRKDVTVNRKISCKVPNALSFGYSSQSLAMGDLFVYVERTSEGPIRRLAMCHGLVKPHAALGNEKIMWYILAQVANSSMTSTYERWVEPIDVIETVIDKYINPHILAFFKSQLEIRS